MEWTADSARIIVATMSGQVVFVNPTTLEIEETIQCADAPITGMGTDASGTELAIATSDHETKENKILAWRCTDGVWGQVAELTLPDEGRVNVSQLWRIADDVKIYFFWRSRFSGGFAAWDPKKRDFTNIDCGEDDDRISLVGIPAISKDGTRAWVPQLWGNVEWGSLVQLDLVEEEVIDRIELNDQVGDMAYVIQLGANERLLACVSPTNMTRLRGGTRNAILTFRDTTYKRTTSALAGGYKLIACSPTESLVIVDHFNSNERLSCYRPGPLGGGFPQGNGEWLKTAVPLIGSKAYFSPNGKRIATTMTDGGAFGKRLRCVEMTELFPK